jgi:beta-phosphoglucomutase
MLPSLPDLKAIFFDLDNVLVFSEVLHFKSWQKVIQQYGISPNAIHFESMIGISDLAQAKQLIKEFSIDEDTNTLWELKRTTFLELSTQGFESPSGRDSFLERISPSYIVGLVSSSGQKVINSVLKLEKISHYFDFIIGHEDCLRHKPDPLPYQQALAQANVEPHQALVIEDSVSGIKAALGASVPVIGLLKDQTPDQILKEIKYFTNFNDIDRWIEGKAI